MVQRVNPTTLTARSNSYPPITPLNSTAVKDGRSDPPNRARTRAGGVPAGWFGTRFYIGLQE